VPKRTTDEAATSATGLPFVSRSGTTGYRCRVASGGPLIHIGYQKTGTSWLQRYVFPNRDLGFDSPVAESSIKKHLVAPHDLAFDAGAVRDRYLPRIQKLEQEGLVPVLSAERLSGDPHFRRHDNVRIADRLAASFPEGRILIVVREQRAAILATYKQYVASGGLLSLDRYLRAGGSTPHWPFELDQFAYDRLIEHYHRRFGPERVLALPFELFVRDGRDFVSRIVRFAGATSDDAVVAALPFGARENPANPPLYVAVKRRVNPLLRHRLTPWGAIHPKKGAGRLLVRTLWNAADRAPARLNAHVEEGMRAAVAGAAGDHYRESNARTSELIGIDLGDYGYDLPRSRAPEPTRS
jgi:hypothetical protein